MINNLPKNIGLFIFLILFQVLILNHIEFSGFINPYLYVLFILILPLETPKWFLLVTAFFLGLSVDLFSHTLGMHACATVTMAFLRPYLLKVIAPREGYETGAQPNARFFGMEWFIRYATILVVVHHSVLFYIEVFSFHQFFSTLLRVILSSIFTLILIVMSQFLTLKR
jgi:rod shape-determining protein MreD